MRRNEWRARSFLYMYAVCTHQYLYFFRLFFTSSSKPHRMQILTTIAYSDISYFGLACRCRGPISFTRTKNVSCMLCVLSFWFISLNTERRKKKNESKLRVCDRAKEKESKWGNDGKWMRSASSIKLLKHL